ncbi:MAG TPA: transposase [Anaerolineaceae bacterium]|jgi:transposase-like protein|nr:transposase [Anaerolineaceae bacterium]
MKKQYTAKQKAQIVLEILKEEKSISQIASEHGIHPNQLYKWKAQALESLPRVFEDGSKTGKVQQAAHAQEVSELYEQIGRLSTQIAWLKKKSGLEPIEK